MLTIDESQKCDYLLFFKRLVAANDWVMCTPVTDKDQVSAFMINDSINKMNRWRMCVGVGLPGYDWCHNIS